MGMVRDTWQAVLVLVVGTLLLEAAGLRRRGPAEPAAAPPTVATQLQPMPAWQQQTPIVVTSEPERPLRRVASAVTELFDSAIGVIR
jgi:hypothetical protein